MTFTVAIVGRPNVGKSTLFNRLAGRRLALVDDQPGLTRDRREADAELGACTVRLIDTAGLERGDEGLTPRMRSQTEAAIAQADLVLFLVDARTGIVPADEMFADLVRGADRKVILAANKCEGRAAEPGLYEAYSLGLGEPLPISAEHGLGIGDLADAIEQACKQAVAVAEAPDGEGLAADEGEAEGPHKLRIAVVGRPNVGKSTLVNALLGEERMITGPEAGITRDAVAVDLAFEGRPLLLFDTAGLRRKMRVEGRAEELSVGDALKAIRFAEVVVLLLDAERPFEKQDLQIAALVEQEGRALVIAVNKWDLVRDRARRLRELQETCQRLLPQLKRRGVGSSLRMQRAGPRRPHARGTRSGCLVEPQAPDACAERLATNGGRGARAARGIRPAHQAQIHHASQCASADLRAVLLAAEGAARLLPALSGERLARDVRHAGRADQAASAQGRQPLRLRRSTCGLRRAH